MVLDVATGGLLSMVDVLQRHPAKVIGQMPQPMPPERQADWSVVPAASATCLNPVQPSSQSFGLLRSKKVWCNPLNLSTRCLPAKSG